MRQGHPWACRTQNQNWQSHRAPPAPACPHVLGNGRPMSKRCVHPSSGQPNWRVANPNCPSRRSACPDCAHLGNRVRDRVDSNHCPANRCAPRGGWQTALWPKHPRCASLNQSHATTPPPVHRSGRFGARAIATGPRCACRQEPPDNAPPKPSAAHRASKATKTRRSRQSGPTRWQTFSWSAGHARQSVHIRAWGQKGHSASRFAH